MLIYHNGGKDLALGEGAIRSAVAAVLAAYPQKRNILLLPPDFTRCHSLAGQIACQFVQDNRVRAIMPTLGTHRPMTREEQAGMFPGVPAELFRTHNWRENVERVGTLPASFIREISEGAVDYGMPIEFSRELLDPAYDLIVSIGQVVPHEVAGMANFTKNIFVGAGGAEGINKSHFLGAAYGMERIMGRADNPVRKVFDYAVENFLGHLSIVYILTVLGPDTGKGSCLRGLYAGNDSACFREAAALSRELNIFTLAKPLQKAVVYLDEREYKSTWLGNKAIYRTRLAMADGGQLIVLAPGVREFGEDPLIDRLIRKYGYAGTEKVLALTAAHDDLQANLGTAAHLIHGSPEGRFTVTYCPGHLDRAEIEGVYYRYREPGEALRAYDPARLSEGYNTLPGGGEIYFISNPALGLWEYKP